MAITRGGGGGGVNRLDAGATRHVAANAIPGKIRDAEKACILSHRRAIDGSRQDNAHSLIVEDDAQFGPGTFQAIGTLGEAFSAFDLVFTDLVFGNPRDMVYYFMLRKELLNSGTLKLIDLKEIFFASSTAYLINSGSKEKMLGLIDALPAYELPYDLQLRNWVRTGSLKAGFVFSFLTTVSGQADLSAIQMGEKRMKELASNAYRRLMWVNFEQTPENPLASLSTLDATHFDVPSLYFGQIMAAWLSPKSARQ
jgi:GR25 family glycosyltransferase involved in LPS biosynthesis